MVEKIPSKLIYLKTLSGLVIILGLLSSCKEVGSDKSLYPATINIDTADYSFLQKRFKVRELWKAPNYLGGLNPSYPIALAYQDFEVAKDTDWASNGLILSFAKIIIKKDNNYIFIANRAELKSVYAPITSKQEALSYSILYTRFFPVFDPEFFKSSYTYYGDEPTISYINQRGDNYYVHLFSYTTFGCEHPYYSIIVKVSKVGNVEIQSKTKAFQDPNNHLCVD